MFDLEQSIAEWRRQMRVAGIKTPVPLEELESHLREEIERRIQSGASEQRAFEMAVRQIGHGKELKTEFARGRSLRSLLEMELVSEQSVLKWVTVLFFIVGNGLWAFPGRWALFKEEAFSEATPFQRWSSLAGIAVSFLLLNGGLFGYKFFPVISDKRVRHAIGACCDITVLLSWMIFFACANVNFQQFATESTWVCFVPFGALIGLALGLERAAQKKPRMAGS